jgi:hypothetical protein
MAETCWFCTEEYDKGEGKSNHDLKVHLVHVLDRTETKLPTRIHIETLFEEATIYVPRCSACAKKIVKSGLKGSWICAVVGMFVGALLLITGEPEGGLSIYIALAGGAVGGFLLGFFFGSAVGNGVEKARANNFPSIKALIDSDWYVGNNP